MSHCHPIPITRLFRAQYQSPIGICTCVASDDALLALWITGQRIPYYMQNAECIDTQSHPIFNQTFAWLNHYFLGSVPQTEVPLATFGTDFQRLVWAVLRTIPYGKLITYGEIAKIIAAKLNVPRMSAQAVGNAVGRNPIAIIIPCHRVVATNGLGGYQGGLSLKRKLLSIEKIKLSNAMHQ